MALPRNLALHNSTDIGVWSSHSSFVGVKPTQSAVFEILPTETDTVDSSRDRSLAPIALSFRLHMPYLVPVPLRVNITQQADSVPLLTTVLLIFLALCWPGITRRCAIDQLRIVVTNALCGQVLATCRC